MQAGRLDRRIDIEQPSDSRDSIGGRSTSWSVWKTVWAGKDDRGAREWMTDQIEQGEVETVWRIRDVDGLDFRMRIDYEGTKYDIVSIREIGRREGFILGTKAEKD